MTGKFEIIAAAHFQDVRLDKHEVKKREPSELASVKKIIKWWKLHIWLWDK